MVLLVDQSGAAAFLFYREESALEFPLGEATPSDFPVNAMPDLQRTASEIAGMRVNPVAAPSMASIQAVLKEPPTTPPMIGPLGHPQPKALPLALPEDPPMIFQ